MADIDATQLPADADLTEIARAYVNMWNQQDRSAIPQLVAETFTMYDPAIPAKGVTGPKGEAHGRDGLRQFMDVLTSSSA